MLTSLAAFSCGFVAGNPQLLYIQHTKGRIIYVVSTRVIVSENRDHLMIESKAVSQEQLANLRCRVHWTELSSLPRPLPDRVAQGSTRHSHHLARRRKMLKSLFPSLSAELRSLQSVVSHLHGRRSSETEVTTVGRIESLHPVLTSKVKRGRLKTKLES